MGTEILIIFQDSVFPFSFTLQSFDELLHLAERGSSRNVDMLVCGYHVCILRNALCMSAPEAVDEIT